ncbi:chemotaxis protein CheW [Xenophilus arseniciresistens]|uniref:Chemotaxis protein CheW n=1 Tax=Xenophilus arseniciresistens TaxID=1283306 RepID=A0AAE3N5S6_9BURK|nr:chemotaxis protein CheW [Xenophilus arseniciresistens]MDA7415388.1 chemotaxis protein CheW [Xenophilus arseniciresistens]
MATREALREFQARLAGRLQSAHTTNVAAWLAVEAGAGRYLFPLGQAGEIFPWTAPTPVPYTQPWYLGVANLRGGLWGVAQLSAFMGDPAARTQAVSEAAREQTRLVAFNEVLEVNCALVVDRLVGLRGLEAFASSQAPDESAPPWMGATYTTAEGENWQELNLQVLASRPEFLSIGA